MKEKKLNLPTICHLVLMGLLCALSVVSVVIIFSGSVPAGFETSGENYRTTITLYGVAHILNALALICGGVYLIKGSGKNVATLYKCFILLVSLGVLSRLIGTFIHPGFGLSVCLMIAILIALLVLTFVKDLGKRNSMIVLCVLLLLELVQGIVSFDVNEVLSSIVGNLSRLVLAGTIGIAMSAKYADKEARGTK
ncbi:MAG: hypothetical protein J6Z79_00180 [Clostridia bacterium]|nr:hypothetical protein [Clostridia bacterium]